MDKLTHQINCKVDSTAHKVFNTIAESEWLSDSALLRKLITEYTEKKLTQSQAICDAANSKD